LEIHFGICVDKIYSFILVKKVATFGYEWVFLSHGNLSLTSKNFKLISQQIGKCLSFSNQSLQGRMLEVLPWRVGGRSAEGTQTSVDKREFHHGFGICH
jgi:hypothetical protein